MENWRSIMGNYSQYKNVDTVFGGNKGVKLPSGATANRPSGNGYIRYNTDTGYIENLNSEGWTSIATPPSVTGVTGTLDATVDATLTISGINFANGCTVEVTGAGVNNVDRALTTTFVNTSTLTVATNATAVNYVSGVNYDIKVTNPSGLFGTLSPAGVTDTAQSWSTPAGSLGIVYDAGRAGTSYTLTATDPDGDAVTYSITSGSLPTGATLNSSTGVISGFSAVGADATSTFTVRATTANATVDRTFSITVKAPISTTFNYTGSDQAFTPPAGVNAVSVKMWGAGGGVGVVSGWSGGGTPGAGGYSSGTVTVTGGNTYTVVVGERGNPSDPGRSYGGGGRAANTWGPGSGAGLSGFFDGSGTVFSGATPQSGAHGRSLLIAGGGGGGGSNRNPGSTDGGAGGGTTGQNGEANYGNNFGAGGTQNAGGGGNGGTGSALSGSDCNVSYGAGGGGGYYGGGAGYYQEPLDMGGGGGGSGYAHPTLVSSATLTGGSRNTPGNSGDSDRGSAGSGDNGGKVIITY